MERLSWRAKLAKNNINILNITTPTPSTAPAPLPCARWYYEFQYHPKPGQVKWCKTYADIIGADAQAQANIILQEALSLRKELEG